MDASVALSLTETVAWVSARAVAADAGRTTRSEVLRPPWFPRFSPDDFSGLMDTLMSSPAEQRRALEHIIGRRRSELLSRQTAPAGKRAFREGRILCTDFESDLCCAATKPSHGFFDAEDIAGWDTWFHHVDTGRNGGVIACWIPPQLLEQVADGAYAIPVNSAWWDDEAPASERLF